MANLALVFDKYEKAEEALRQHREALQRELEGRARKLAEAKRAIAKGDVRRTVRKCPTVKSASLLALEAQIDYLKDVGDDRGTKEEREHYLKTASRATAQLQKETRESLDRFRRRHAGMAIVREGAHTYAKDPNVELVRSTSL